MGSPPLPPTAEEPPVSDEAVPQTVVQPSASVPDTIVPAAPSASQAPTRTAPQPPPAAPADVAPALDAAFTGVRYRPLRFHAAGGLGEVYVAQDAELNREVALKRIRDGRHSGDAAERFRREGEITGRLEH